MSTHRQWHFDGAHARQQIGCLVHRPDESVIAGKLLKVRDRTITIEVKTVNGALPLGEEVRIDFAKADDTKC